ncbi:amino acid ABC transporter substrate-binding protein [Candidatus Deferrimicrobium sp.]|uniref:amino acid ABC transporter substrate-binding protein n=1 Tax=Candidatus Deferrimicrobium sp. TaxID=3060586 RepID=UPI00271BD0D6|nr:amino acid ABC transporter substrate-binding protein [Candidatus Deferrimicrobium sp.]MDO8738829.1 amino acid ABC transporter substrate-binding protein [Candidatus Deferrimicrobium sp.]
MKRRIKRREFLQSAGVAGLGMALGSFPWNALGALDKGVVHFGGSLALTGTYGKVAKMYKDGYEFYMEAIKNKIVVGGKTYDAKLTLYDDENDPTKTAQLTEKLINVDKVDLIVGAYGTDTVLAQSAVCKKYNRILIQGGAASRRVDEEYGANNTFTLVSTGDTYHTTLIDLASKLNPPIKTVGIITMDDPVYQEMAKAAKERCEKAGMQVVFEDILPMNTTDLSSTVLKMKGKQIDMVINTGWDKILASFVNEAIKYKLKIKLLDGGHATISPFLKESLGKRMKNILGVTFWLPEAKTKPLHFKDSIEFGTKFQKRFGYEPDYHVALAAQLLELYETVLKGANPKDPFNTDAIRQALLKTDQNMLYGRVRFNQKGRLSTDMLVIQWQGDPPKPVIIYPAKNATGKMIYPSDPLAG